MALIRCNFYSQALMTGTEIQVIIPTPDSEEVSTGQDTRYFHPGVRYPVLYLLHGAYGDATDWARFTSIERYAQHRHMAVVMPSAGNSFYQNMYIGQAYIDYFNEELPTFVETLFPVSTRREDTFVAGLSMGGYGCYRLAVECPQRYSAAASLSGAIDIAYIMDGKGTNGPFNPQALFADPAHITGSEADIFARLQALQKQGQELPRFFQSCGTEDFIYPANQSAKAKLEALGVNLTYEEHPGIHNWAYWDTHIQRAMDWMLQK